MTGKTINLILLGVLVGVLLGGILGAVIPAAMLATALVGKLFMHALALVAMILVLVGFPLALAKYGDLRRFDNSSAGSFIMTVSSAVVLIAVGVVLVRLVAAQALSSLGFTAAVASDFFQVQAGQTGDFVGALVPDCLLRAVLNGSYLGWVLFALVFGLVLPGVGTRGRTLQSLLEDITNTMTRIAELLLLLAPIGLMLVTGVLVARAGVSFTEMFSLLWYPIVLVIAILLYSAVVLPMTLKWWQKVPESKGQREDYNRNRGDRPNMQGGRPGQRPMGDRDRGGRGRDQRFDRNRDRDRDRSDRPDRPDRPDRQDRPDRPDRDRNDRHRGDRDDRGDRDRGRRDFRRDRPENPRPEPVREDSPFAVSKSSHVFDPEAPAQAVPMPELIEEAAPQVISEDRPAGDSVRNDRGDRNDRGPRDRRDRDRRGGGRDRQGRGGRDRGRGGDRPRHFDRSNSGEGQSAPESVNAESESNDFTPPSDLSRIFDPVPGIEVNEYIPRETPLPEPSSPSPREESEYSGRTESIPESEPEVAYGRHSRGHHHERTERNDSPAPAPTPSPEAAESEPKPIDHYSPDGIAFGRANRRKRMR